MKNNLVPLVCLTALAAAGSPARAASVEATPAPILVSPVYGAGIALPG